MPKTCRTRRNADAESSGEAQEAQEARQHEDPGETMPEPTPSTSKKKVKHHSSYSQELVTLPASKTGIAMQCKLINGFVGRIREKYNLKEEVPSETSIASASNEFQKAHTSGPIGKVGLHIRQQTLLELDQLLVASSVEFGDPENQLLGDLQQGEDLTSENIQDTLEGLDRDLLGVDSQVALDKLSAFVARTLADNHPSRDSSAGTSGGNLNPPKVPPQKQTKSLIPSAKDSDPFKFAFLSVVATYDAKCVVPLQNFHAQVRCVSFDPTFFHSAVLTFPRSECRVAVFENGKFVITGVTTIKMGLVAARNVLELFRMCGYQPDVSKRNFRAKNLTAMLEMGVHLDINGFAEKYPMNTYIDQDTFGAVTHFPEKTSENIQKGGMGMCLLIFATGRIVLVGGKTEKHMIAVFRDKTLNMLKPFAYGYL